VQVSLQDISSEELVPRIGSLGLDSKGTAFEEAAPEKGLGGSWTLFIRPYYSLPRSSFISAPSFSAVNS